MHGGGSVTEDGATEFGEFMDMDWIKKARECDTGLKGEMSSAGEFDIPGGSRGGVRGRVDDDGDGCVASGKKEKGVGTVLARGRTVANWFLPSRHRSRESVGGDGESVKEPMEGDDAPRLRGERRSLVSVSG
jgi:hypothetical protein